LPEPVTIECRKEADVVFVIDSTSNLQEKDFQLYILGTIAEIVQHLDVDLGRTRVAAVYFTDTAKVCIISIYYVKPSCGWHKILLFTMIRLKRKKLYHNSDTSIGRVLIVASVHYAIEPVC